MYNQLSHLSYEWYYQIWTDLSDGESLPRPIRYSSYVSVSDRVTHVGDKKWLSGLNQANWREQRGRRSCEPAFFVHHTPVRLAGRCAPLAIAVPRLVAGRHLSVFGEVHFDRLWGVTILDSYRIEVRHSSLRKNGRATVPNDPVIEQEKGMERRGYRFYERVIQKVLQGFWCIYLGGCWKKSAMTSFSIQ